MSSRCTLTKCVRWRVRDWASCLLPSDNEQDVYCPLQSQLPIGNMVFELKDDGKPLRRRRQKHRKIDREDKHSNISLRRCRARSTVSTENVGVNSSGAHFNDEEYIVFCFREDGDFDILKDVLSEEHSNPPKGEGGGSGSLDTELDSDDVSRASGHHGEEETPIQQGTVSVESSDSNYSDCSTSSFAFPALGLEWEYMGSPVQMPRPDD